METRLAYFVSPESAESTPGDRTFSLFALCIVSCRSCQAAAGMWEGRLRSDVANARSSSRERQYFQFCSVFFTLFLSVYHFFFFFHHLFLCFYSSSLYFLLSYVYLFLILFHFFDMYHPSRTFLCSITAWFFFPIKTSIAISVVLGRDHVE